MKEALECYKGFIFKSSSLLMVYSGEESPILTNNNNTNIMTNNSFCNGHGNENGHNTTDY